MDKIRENYPKSWVKLKEWLDVQLELLTKHWISTMPDDLLDAEIPIPPKTTDEGAIGMLMWYRRRLYDFFDNHQIYITTGTEKAERLRWRGYIYLKGVTHGVIGDTREIMENLIFEQAFKLLEEKL